MEPVDGVRRIKVLLTVGLIGLVTVSASQILGTSTALPLIERAFGHARVFGWFFSGFALVGLVGISTVSLVEQRIGISRTLLLCASIFSIGLLAASLSQNAYEILAARAVQGLGSEPVIVLSYILAARYFKGRAASRLFAILASAWVLPSLVVPGLAGWVAVHLSWRWDFVGLIPVVIIAQLVCQSAIDRADRLFPVESEGTPISAGWTVWSSRGSFIGGIILGLSSFSIRSPIFRFPLLLLASGLLILGLRGLVGQARLERPSRFYLLLLQRSTVAVACFGLEGFIPLIINSTKGVSPALAGLAITASTVLWTAGSWIQARFSQSRGLVARLRFGWIFAILGLLTTLFTVADGPLSYVWVSMAWGVANFGMGLIYPAVSVEVLNFIGAGGSGTPASVMQMVDTSSAGIGTGLIGVILGAGTTGVATGASFVHLSNTSVDVAIGIGLMATLIGMGGTLVSAIGG